MRRFQSILYVTRGITDETSALKQALSLTRNNAAELHVLVVSPVLPKGLADDPQELDGYKAAYETSLIERAKASIAHALADLKMSPDDVHVTTEVECGDTPAVRIVRRVLRKAHDMIIKQAEPTGHHAGFQALDMQLLRLCPCPVWLCRPISRSRTDIRVAVAVDPHSAEPAGHDLALQLLRLSKSLADTCSGVLSIVSCWDYPFEDSLRNSPWVKLSEEAISANVHGAERQHAAALEALIQESGVGDRIRVYRPRGRPDQEIAKLIEELEIDILVMGTVARTGIQGFVIGNTAENTLRELRCSLVALKPNGFVSSVRAY